MTDQWSEDHAAGKHQHEVVSVIKKIEPCLHGHSRAINIIALTRLIAVMLGPAQPEARKAYLDAIPDTLGSILNEMDRMMQEYGNDH